ncbi:MAG TPA: DUF1570 domain-containing protein [Isosphaeraceae bacterium]|jgi:hypothetical protein|nr:DUF1570 domain-containing protein [Isosphaeraceae bacterium]
MIQALGVLGFVLLVQIPPPQAASELASALRAERQALRAKETAQLEAVASRLDTEGKKPDASEVRSRIEPAPPLNGPTIFKPMPEVIAPARGLANVPAAGLKWRAEVQGIRTQSAKDLFSLAQQAANAKRFALADDCLRAVLVRQPDHAEARRLLGFVPYNGGWATPYAAKKLKDGEVKHPEFGWVPADWVAHLDKGELPAPIQERGQKPAWIPADQADALRQNWENAWQISTEHFRISTNVPMSEAIAFGRQIEAFHDLFFSVMADVIGPDLPLAKRFADPKKVARPSEKPHLVCYFASKDEFVQDLAPKLGENIAQSLGVYIMPREAKALGQRNRAWKDPKSYFYRDAGGQLPITATLYHEVSHQLLFESASDSRIDLNNGNYWVFEGLGTYFETLEAGPDGELLLGGLGSKRIQVALVRLVRQKEFIPISELVNMSKARFNAIQAGDVHLNYAEANALAVFLMQFDDGRYRDDFLDYVRFAYQGRGSSHALNTLLGVPYSRLDEQVLAFLKEGLEKAQPK